MTKKHVTAKVKPKEDEFNPNCLPKYIPTMTWEETEVACARLSFQFKVIHDLPKIDGKKPSEYMHETIHGLNQQCIALHWRRIELVQKKYKPA